LCAPSQWYAHQGTTVWLVTGGADRVKGLTYWDKGWTSFEFALAMLIKPANTSTLKDWPQVVDLGKEGDAQTAFARPALSEPLAFFGGHEYGDKTYTNGADRDAIVAPKFRETIFEVMGGVGELNFGKLKWGDAEIKALAVVLPLCGRLTKLMVHENAFGDAIMVELAGAMWNLDKLTFLSLGANAIGDAGIQALADALSKGALDHLTVRWRSTALFPCLETRQVYSTDSDVLFDVQYADARAQLEPDWRRGDHRSCHRSWERGTGAVHLHRLGRKSDRRCRPLGSCRRTVQWGPGPLDGALAPHCLVPMP
jgi:hypothetical protein